jgi:micrococcal nuclease
MLIRLKKMRGLTICFILALFIFDADARAASKEVVVKTVDGDTLRLSSGETVRLIGIDTPEASNNAKTRRDSKRTRESIDEIIVMGKKASRFTRALVQGSEVTLEYDVEKRDRYGRLLAYVYFPVHGTNWLQVENGIVKSHLENANLPVAKSFDDTGGKGVFPVMLNAYLIQEGYAQVMTVAPNVKYQEIFLRLQREAREKQKGLWREGATETSQPAASTPKPPRRFREPLK